MAPLPKYRKAKRPTVLVTKRTQLKRKTLVTKSRNLVYERLKANNIALAKALSNEKQESQYLFTQNVHLTSQIQERDVSINRRDAAMMGILKNSSELLVYLVEATDRVTRTIAACQQFVGLQRPPPTDSTPSTSTAPRRESTRRSTVKSPARGVVQPMVSGHTITKPVINLSRINMPRIRTSPNLSDIEEAMSSPENNSSHSESRNSVRIPRNPPTLLANRRLEGLLPERIRLTSPRMTDESDRLSDSRSRRLSNRRSGRHSRKLSRSSDHQVSPNQSRLSMEVSPQSSANQSRLSSEDLREMIRNPRVALEDVSKLLQKSHSINVRTLLESSEFQSHQETTAQSMEQSLNNSNSPQSPNEDLANKNSPIDSDLSPTYGFDPRTVKEKKQNETEDPLEGPSWLHNDSGTIESSGQDNFYIDESLLPNSSTMGASNNSVLMQTRVERSPLKSNQTKSETPKRQWSTRNYGASPNSAGNNDDDEDDGEKCQNLSQFLGPFNPRHSFNDNDEPTGFIHLPENVTRRRGQPVMNDDDLTLLLNRRQQQTRPVLFDMNELELPVLETPLINPVEVEPEPEITTTVRMLTHTIHRMPSMARENVSIMGDNTSVICPAIRDSTIRLSSDFEGTAQSNQDDSFVVDRNVLKRKRTIKNRIDSTSSDSEPSATPKKLSIQDRNVSHRKDPSSAKVVLEKLEASGTKKTSSTSLSSRSSSNLASLTSQQTDVLSDSESSNASSKTSTGRPRRQKAPANLMEPKLNTKLRRH